MKRLRILLLILLPSVAVAQPVVTWRPPMNCATNDALKWNGSAWVCSGAPMVTGSGTTNTIPKWTGASTLGNSAISDDTTTVDVVVPTSTGKLRVKPSVDALGNLGTLQLGGVRTDITGIFSAVQLRPVMGSGYTSGFTIDTFDAGGAAINTNLLTIAPLTRAATFPVNVSINGNATLGDATTDLHTINGTVTQTSAQGGGVPAFGVTNTGAAVANAYTAMRGRVDGSFDATAASRTNDGVQGLAFTTRSAGANNVTNRGVVADATGGQVNQAIYADRGDVLLNATSGTTTANLNFLVNGNATIGDNSGTDSLTVKQGTATTAAAAPAGTVLALEGPDAGSNFLTLRSTGTSALLFANSSSGSDGQLAYNNASRAMELRTAGFGRLLIDSNGAFTLGDAGSEAVADNVDVFTIGNTGTGQTSGGKAVVKITNSGSYNTTSAALDAAGVVSIMTATRSAGSNSLTQRAGYFSASGAQTNYALNTDVGDNRFNQGGGLSQFDADVDIGNANTDTLTISSKIDAHVHYTGTAPSVSACGTGATISGSDMRGIVTPGTGSPTACTLTFATSWATNYPVCVGIIEGAGITLSIAASGGGGISTSAITFNASAALAGDKKIHYFCDGRL